MNCEMAEKNLSAYLDDMLDPQLHEEMAAHLESCALCSEVVAEYRRFDTLLSETSRVSPPPELRDRIFNSPEMAAILRHRPSHNETRAEIPAPRPRRSLTRGSPPRWARIALQSAAVFAIIVGSALLLKQGFFHFGTTTTGHTSTPIIGNPGPNGAPLAAGSRVVYLHDGALWSAPEDGPDIGQQLTPASIQVGAIWSISPDGRFVAYVEAGSGRIHIIRADGQSDVASSSFSAICRTSAPCAGYPPSLAWSPNGKYIAYQSSDGTLHLLTAANTNDQIVSAGQQGIVTAFLWSSDSQRLAFVGVNGPAESIWSFDFASGLVSQVAANPDSAKSAATLQEMFWLPDTRHPTLTWTAWVASTQSLTGIFARDLSSGSAVQRLTPPTLQLTGAGFTPHQGNGVWLLAATTQNGAPEIGTVAASHPVLQITNAALQTTVNGTISGVYWSPLGDTAALVSTSGQLFLTTHNGASLSEVLSDVTGTPLWSGDGSHLATPLNIGIISLDVQEGSPTGVYNLLPSVPTPTTVTMLWSPDNQDIAIATPSGTYLTSSDGKKIKQVDSQTATGLFSWSSAG